jgi:peptide-methionine (S)-S-oxide reductase
MSMVRPRSLNTATSAGAKEGDFVTVHYTGTLDDGSVFDSSRKPGREPLPFTVGGGQVVRGFDQAVMGLKVGETRKSRISPEDAYGEVNPELVISFPASQAPAGLEVGNQVQMSNGMIANVTKVTPEEITIDLNPRLAGKHLTFDVELMTLTPKERMMKATFGAGCFWSVELAFQRVEGVLATEVGYCNGQLDDPTYDDVCTGDSGHAEVVQVTYDPEVVSFEKLLDVFWGKHDPTTLNRQGGDVGTQYRSGIYYHNLAQKEMAHASKHKAQERFSGDIVTEIAEISKYTKAEAYHQQYLARGGRFGKAQSPKKGCTDPIRCYG